MKIADNDLIDAALANDKDSIKELIDCLEPLIISSIRKYHYRQKDFDDLLQEGRLEILNCLKTYDRSKGVHFLGYAKTCLRYLYLNMNGEKKVLSLDYETEGEDPFISFLASEENLEEDFVLREEIRALRGAMEKLSAIERESIILFYLKGYSIGEIAEAKGLAYRTVVNNKTRGLKKLKSFLTGK